MPVKILNATRVMTPSGFKEHLQFNGKGNTFCGKAVDEHRLDDLGGEQCKLCQRSAHVFRLHGWEVVVT